MTPKKDERRSRAEQKLTGRRTDITGLSQVELERIVHELEGHQIELQIQNEELERQKELFKRMYDYIPVMLILWDPALRRFTLNNYAEDLLGWTTEEANRGDFMSMVYPDPDYRRRVEEYMKSLDTGWQEWEVTTREGARIPSEWANVWLADDTMIGIGVDLRERKQAEEDLSKAREELLASIRERNRELSEVEKKLRALTEASSEVMYSMSADWKVMHRLISGSFLTNTEEPRLHWMEGYIPVDEQPLVKAAIEDAIQGKKVFELEHRVLRADGSVGWTHSRAVPVLSDNGEILEWFGVASDVTEHHTHQQNLEQTVRERTAELWRQMGELTEAWKNMDLVIEYIPDAIVITDRENRIVFANPAAESKLRRKKEDLLGTDFPYEVSRKTTELRIAAGDEARYLEARAVDIMWKERPCRLVTMRDITDRQESAWVIRSLSRRLLEVQEAERREIGSLLHDEVGGTLTVLKLALNQVRKAYGEKAAASLEEINQIINELADQVRHVSHTMRPSMLDDYGLIEALQWFIERYERRTGITANLKYNAMADRLPSHIETTAYRIIQEALNNAGKHSGAQTVEISIDYRNNVLYVSVRDTGAGFDMSARHSGAGLRGMNDMAELAGGKLIITSTRGKGTTLDLRLPVIR